MKNLNRKIIATTLASMMLFTACTKTEMRESRETNERTTNETLTNDPNAISSISYEDIRDTDYDENLYTRGYNNYSFELLRNVIDSEEDDTNLMISPASVMFALDLCAAGANGNTLTEINNLFAPNSDPMEQQAFASQFMRNMNRADGLSFSCANAIWGNSTYLGNNVSSEYLEYVEDTFDATYTATPFSMDTVDQINSWVDEHTNHMIDRVLAELSSDCTMVLVNAIAFESEWEIDYDDYQVNDRDFHNANGSTSTVSMMSGTEYNYFETELATGFMKTYAGGDYAFLVMLPTDEDLSANEFIEQFTGEDYQNFIGSLTHDYEVYTWMPEFSYDYDTSLSEVIEAMGVHEAFTENADFTGITTSTGLCISDIIHKTHIDVNRTGTSAAAVTAIMLETCGIAEESTTRSVHCDRPYAYAIVDVNNGYAPIFVGTVNEL